MTVFLINIFIIIMNFIYLFYKLLPTRNKIVMISRQSNNINLDFKLLGKELSKKYKVIYLCKTLEGGAKSKFKTKINYGFHMFKQMYHLATAKVCILDSYCPTVSILHHKKSLTVIQIWHSIGTMKKFGYSILDKEEGSNYKIAKAMKMHKNYDIVYCSGNAYKEHLQQGFNININKIKIFTLPRIDMLKNKTYETKVKNKIFKKYPQLKNKINILYAPTFRKNEKEFNNKVEELIKNINLNKYNLIIKLHPLSKIVINDKNIIVDKSFSTFDMLFIADKLISDYSCIIYEAGVRDIPLYFYMFDLEKYKNNRGLTIDIKELPGYIAHNAKELIDMLERKYDMIYQKKFIKKYRENTKMCTNKMVKDIKKYSKEV